MLKGVLAGIVSGATVMMFAKLTSSFTDFNSRIALASDGSATATENMARLHDMAQRTYSSFENTAESFLQNKTALEGLGLSTLQQLDYTESLNNAMVISGAKAERAASVQKALADAMMLGKLSGEGLNTILKNGGRITELLAAELGTTADKLKGLGAEGKITGSVIYNSLVGNFQKLRTEAEEMPATIEDGFLRIRNSLFYTIGMWDQNNQASARFAAGLVWVSDNMSLVLTILSPLMAALTIMAVQVVGGMMVSSFMAASVAIGGTVTAMGKLLLAMAANPFVAIGLAIAGILIYFIDWEKAIQNVIRVFGQLMTILGDLTGNEGMTRAGINITINADKAAEQLKEAAKEMHSRITLGGQQAAPELKKALVDGGNTAAGAIARGMKNAALSSAQIAEAQQKSAIANYENMNGKAVKEIGNAHVEGGKYVYNAATGGLTKGAGEVNKSITEGGDTAGKSIQKSMENGAATVYNSIESAFATLAPIFDVFAAFMRQLRSEIALTRSEINKNEAESAKLRAEADAIRMESRYGSGKGGGGGGGSGGGGGGGDGNYYAGSQLNPLNLMRDAREEAKPAAPTGPQVVGTGQIEINNVIDAGSFLAAINTVEGRKTVMNLIKNNREDFQAVLGVI
jgi:tape measure domain-containing protein